MNSTTLQISYINRKCKFNVKEDIIGVLEYMYRIIEHRFCIDYFDIKLMNFVY